MFPSFIGILDIQSWWEVPSISYFCSLFRTAFNLLDFDIEELEEALLTDGTEESASSLLTELIVRLLNGCLGNNDVSAFNYQMYLRRLFRRKCQETGRYNPFNTDIDFQFLPLRTKVEILYALCDFRLDGEDVYETFKNLEAESLRVEPLGVDDRNSAYWYFYGTRLYREDVIRKPKAKNKKKKGKDGKKGTLLHGDDWLDDEETERVWQVVCFTEEDWTHLTEKFSKATSKVEKELYRSLSQNFLPEIPRLFQEKERLQRKRLLELAPRRTSSRVLQKIKDKEEVSKTSETESKETEPEEEEEKKEKLDLARETRAKKRDQLRSKSVSSEASESSVSQQEMPQKSVKRPKGQDKRSKNSSASQKGEPPPEPPVKTGRKTNNSLACATGQILIPEDEPVNTTRKILKTSQIFSQTEEDIQTDMYKVLEQLTAHEDAWPFMDPVEEEYAPNYYAVIRRPMDLKKMEERLDSGYYTDFSMFKADFKLIVNNCRLYNGQDNEYTMMVDNLQTAFDRLTEKYMHRSSSSDEEIAVEYQMPTPSRKHKLKPTDESPVHKKKRKKSHSESADVKSEKPAEKPEEKPTVVETPSKPSKTSNHKTKDGKIKKKRKGHHRHGKHSKTHKKDSHKSGHGSKGSKHSKKQKHAKDKDGKKIKQKKKKNKHSDDVDEPLKPVKRSESQESLESSNRSRSASPLPSIHSTTPSPPPEPAPEVDFYKDKYDKIKERRRNAPRDAWESLFDGKHKAADKKQNLHLPEKDKNQKLRETIEKLKAKNEKYKESSIFNSLFSAGQSEKNPSSSVSKESSIKDKDDSDFTDDSTDKERSRSSKKGTKKVSTKKNESASAALEQAVKDISKWLDDAPKGSSASSPCDSPAQTISTEEHDSRMEDDFPQSERSSSQSRRETHRKRPSSREPKVLKRREIQRTIDRLQPGKSKGNLLTNSGPKSVEKVEEVISATVSKVRDISKSVESSPKLSLGSVLATVEFTLGRDHNFDNDDEPKVEEKNNDVQETVEEKPEVVVETPLPEPEAKVIEKVEEEPKVEPKPTPVFKPSQEKATPNLSAWFKAFGAPKSTNPTVPSKKKSEDVDVEVPEKTAEVSAEAKVSSPKNPVKYDSPTDPETPNPDGGDSPIPNATNTPRQRRTSTGSSVSERSSFSQDLDSPRHQMSHTSPLLRSPASPRTEDFQKITYPIINGTIRAGFYQDTTSIKSSPEKSCSPREGPQSPYSPYSQQHVYVSNNALGSTAPNYFVDHNKSPLPSYTQTQPPPYYDTAKAQAGKSSRTHEDYTSLAPEPYQQSQFSGSYSPVRSPYSQNQHTTYSQPLHSPQTPNNIANEPPKTQLVSDPKTSLFPVKKRTYSEVDTSTVSVKKVDKKESPGSSAEYNKLLQARPNMSVPPASVDDIAAALSEKNELNKKNLREKPPDYHDRHVMDPREAITENSMKKDNHHEAAKPMHVARNDNVDMVNMGYMNPDDRRNSENNEIDYSMTRELHKSLLHSQAQAKAYDMDNMAMNLGMNPHSILKAAGKPITSSSSVIQPAHMHERSHSDATVSHVLSQQHGEYDHMAGQTQSVSNFSLNDIELANKKLYSCNAAAANNALDYGNWKMQNPLRKEDAVPADYSSPYVPSSADKLKMELSSNAAAINYNKNLQHQHYHNYNVPRTPLQRAQDLQQNLPAELRIPNPRSMMKNDHHSSRNDHLANVSSSNAELLNKSMEVSKTQKPDKLIQNHPLVSTIPYKTPYSTHSPMPLDSLRNIPHVLDRYANDERYLPSFPAGGASLYHDKTFQAQMSQIFNKSLSADTHANTSVSYPPSSSMSKDSLAYKTTQSLPTSQVDAKTKTKRKRTSDAKPSQVMPNHSYHSSTHTSDVLSSVKSMVPGSAFNFGATANMPLGSGLYSDNSGFSIEDFRNSTQLMAANYMAAAVAHQRSSAEASAEKVAKPAHQNAAHGGSFPFMGHGQSRAAYPFAEGTSPLYQQYLQRHQEELLRQTGAQIMGLYPPGYPAALATRQPYDPINRPSWL